ncbi:GNAT family N-acetyltransferase [Streptomyces inhibens]|uniref:GNAT family N-acetyltransferase n=1 Tax=Streptomyces inhibens TaxID=2293571 RepID=A0A371PQ84_STRIH|nr:GNAT family N-acetyltransferase [Streptomyces inhibens]REK84657.1 GNAT family N-acetyltransferase [Streptomyces inhibens]
MIVTTSQAFLRTANLDDLDGITDLHTQARATYYQAGGLSEVEITSPDARARRREAWMRSIQSDATTVLCAVLEREIVGTLAMGPPLESAVDAAAVGQLYQIHVRPGCWGQGIGSQLHAAFVQFLRDASLDTGLLEVWERNTRARTFYTRHGWKPDGHPRPGPCDASYVRMRLNLGSDF